MRVFKVSTMFVKNGENQVPDSRNFTIWKFVVKKYEFFLLNCLVPWWAGYLRNYNLQWAFQIQLLWWKVRKRDDCIVRKKLCRRIRNQLCCKRYPCYLILTKFFDKIDHGKSCPVRLLLCTLEVFWRNLQQFQKFLCKLWLLTLLERLVILRDGNSVSNFKLGFSDFS